MDDEELIAELEAKEFDDKKEWLKMPLEERELILKEQGITVKKDRVLCTNCHVSKSKGYRCSNCFVLMHGDKV